MDNPSPTMHDFYIRYYDAAEHSRAHATFCEYAYGRNLCQHGFATMEQLAELIRVAGLTPKSRALDLGCGNGMITEYLADVTGAHFTGLDDVASAIAAAAKRTQVKCHHLDFVVGDLTRPNLPPDSFDFLLSIDTIYFSDDYADTLRQWRALLRRNGHMAIFFSHGVDPEHPKETFRRETLPPDRTPLADVLRQLGLVFQTCDLTQQDYALAQRKKEILTQLKPEFEAEGNLFLYENRIGEALGVADAVESGMHARYLYDVKA